MTLSVGSSHDTRGFFVHCSNRLLGHQPMINALGPSKYANWLMRRDGWRVMVGVETAMARTGITR